MVTVRAATANARFKERFASRVWAGICLSVCLHLAFFVFFPPLGVADLNGEDIPDDDPDVYSVPVAPEIPPPPEPIDRPPRPRVGDIPVVEEPEIAEPDLEQPQPLRPPDREVDAAGGTDVFLVVEIRPKLQNADQLRRLVERLYPRHLRQAGIGGEVEVIAVIDTLGSVVSVRIGRSSGYEGLDQVGLAIVRQLRYSPAMARDRRVRVQIRVPIEFKVR